MSSISKNKKRKNKKKYFQSNKKHRSGVLEAGLKGFLITCNHEHQCVKEAYNLLNEFADDLYGPEFETAEKSSDSKELDIEEELNKEIEAMKTKKRRFQQVCTMVKGILFINTTVPDPTNLATAIFDNVLQTGKRRGRFILKMIPIIVTCKATQIDIRKHLDEYLQEFTKDNKKLSYRIESRIRHNNNISTSHVLWYVRESVEKFAPEWVVSLTEPQLVFSIQILRSICCIGILKNYMEYRKYNLSEAAAINDKDTSQNTPQEDCDEKQDSSDEDNVNDKSNLQNSGDKLQMDENKDDKNIAQNNLQENSAEKQASSNENETLEN
ncbi:THUMP domain-containing protein 1 [Araneus ventricosus]|uniref:THUMP domain-containing protein 1 n=1 Tax=Araneus ventricosus TaxID=182803 RepID=A0A4Y2C2R2_ARAVE|nr:THUMP domain-containing protein 1 [Araneus ventricosus]